MPLTHHQFITRPSALQALADELLRHPVIAIDTESNSLYAYREQVCLIQFSTPLADTLVDPLALDDLSPLAPVFADPAIEKVFHAAEYDLICLKRDFGFEFANLFDTMVAARILGRKQVGLGSMLGAEFGVKQDKRFQRANWGLRPLPPDHLHYAVQDTRYLIPLRDRLEAQLRQAGLWELAQEDFRRLCFIQNHQVDVEDVWWRIPHANELTPQQAAVLQELCDYRDRVARDMNRPRFKVIGSQTLHAIAQNCPGRLEDLAQLPGMTPPQLRRHSRALLQAVQRGLGREPLSLPKPARPDERYLLRLDALRTWRKQAANAMGVESDVVLPKDLMHALADQAPYFPPELRKVGRGAARGMLSEAEREAQRKAVLQAARQAAQQVLAGAPWRLERFGKQIEKLLEKTM